MDEHGDIIKENVVKSIKARGFFHDVDLVLKVLEPLKKLFCLLKHLILLMLIVLLAWFV